MADPSSISESLQRFKRDVVLWFRGLEDIGFADKDGKMEDTLEGLSLAANEGVGSSALSDGEVFFGRCFCPTNS